MLQWCQKAAHPSVAYIEHKDFVIDDTNLKIICKSNILDEIEYSRMDSGQLSWARTAKQLSLFARYSDPVRWELTVSTQWFIFKLCYNFSEKAKNNNLFRNFLKKIALEL